MTFIDRYAYASVLSTYDPKPKLFFALVPLIICIAANSLLVSVLTWAVMCVMTVRFAGIPFKKYIRYMLLPLGFMVMGTLTILVQRYTLADPVLLGVTINGYKYGISVASLYQGCLLISKALAAVSCMYFLSFNTPMTNLFSELGRVKPLGVIVSLMELIYRYIFVLWDEAVRIRTAQESRLGYGGFKKSMKSVGTMASMLFLRAYQRCDRTFAALESRGFEGDLKLVAVDYQPMNKMYWLGGLFGSVLVVIAVTFQFDIATVIA